MQFLRTSSATPGAPPGNMENNRCTAQIYATNRLAANSEEPPTNSPFEVVCAGEPGYVRCAVLAKEFITPSGSTPLPLSVALVVESETVMEIVV
jgi:hypothetical protein